MSWLSNLVDTVSRRRSTPPLLTDRSGPRLDSGRVWQFRDDSTYNPLTHLGSRSRDKGSAARPSLGTMPLSPIELEALYENNGIARRIVDLIPNRATRTGWTVQGLDPTEDETLQARGQVRRAMQMARLYGGCALVMITEDDVPSDFSGRESDWLAEPLDLERVGKLYALQVFDTFEAQPYRYERDPRQPGYRSPRLWSISAPGMPHIVHGSRVLHFRGRLRPPSLQWGGRLSSSGIGIQQDSSELQAIWDEIRRLTETAQGGAVLAQELQQTVFMIKGASNSLVGDQAGEFKKRLSAMKRLMSVLGGWVVGQDDKIEHHSASATGYKDLSEGARAMLAAVTGIPEIVLYGQAPGGLNTDGGSAWEGFRQLVSDYQTTHLPLLNRLYRVMFSAQDRLSTDGDPDALGLTFGPLDEPDAVAVAEAHLLTAQKDVAYIGAGVLTGDDVRAGRFGPGGWSYDLKDLDGSAESDPELDRIIRERFPEAV